LLDQLTFRSFEPHDQVAARRLILNGLGEYFDFIDETLNPDVDDIQQHIVGTKGYFLVVEIDSTLIATGGLQPYGDDALQIVRVSVDPAYRRNGIAREVVSKLIQHAQDRGMRRVVVETTYTWERAIALYQDCGFTDFARHDHELWMKLDLAHE
jgi:ribosomal protein S18 acetylase RimI-like enzyme